MKFFRYWARATETVQQKGRPFDVRCFGGSNVNLEDALKQASERAKAAAAAIARGKFPERYTYGQRPLREEIIEELQHQGKRVAVLSRNSYGSIVLNTASVLFADIDLKTNKPLTGIARKLGKLLRLSMPTEEELIVAKVRAIAEERRDVAFRLYRTANGFRCAVISRTYDPTSDEAIALLRQLDSDPLYIKLCRTQECFRARLTPKHWRCGLPRPPHQFPFADRQAEQRQRQWEDKYQSTTQTYSTCAQIAEIGTATHSAEVDAVLKVHDQIACAGDGPLA